jgi:hypothetical protein
MTTKSNSNRGIPLVEIEPAGFDNVGDELFKMAVLPGPMSFVGQFDFISITYAKP